MISRWGRRRRVLWLDSHPKSKGHVVSSVDGVETCDSIDADVNSGETKRDFLSSVFNRRPMRKFRSMTELPQNSSASNERRRKQRDPSTVSDTVTASHAADPKFRLSSDSLTTRSHFSSPQPPPMSTFTSTSSSSSSTSSHLAPATVSSRRLHHLRKRSSPVFEEGYESSFSIPPPGTPSSASRLQKVPLFASMSALPTQGRYVGHQKSSAANSISSASSQPHIRLSCNDSFGSNVSRGTCTAQDVIAEVAYMRSIGVQCRLSSDSAADGLSPGDPPSPPPSQSDMSTIRQRRRLQQLKCPNVSSAFLSPYHRLSPDESSESSGHSFISPSVSPVPWHVNQREDDSSHFLSSNFHDLEEGTPYTLGIIMDQIQRRGSTTSLNSDHEEPEPQRPEQINRRGRRAAIYNSKNMIGDDNGASPSRSPNDSGTEDAADEGKNARRTSLDIGIGVLPGVDMLKEKHKKILKKQNTIADLTARAYNNTSSTTGDDRKKGGISFLKLIDKKAKSRESLADLQEMLSQLKHSEFRDTYLLSFKDVHWSDLIPHSDHPITTDLALTEMERRRREAVWELFKSELIFLLDHLMVLKHCFLEPLKKLQVDGYLMFVEPQDLFGNLDELCYVSYTFCRDLISTLTKEITPFSFGETELLVKTFKGWTQHSKDGEVFHNYCLNYDCALTYLEILRKYEQFAEFEKWCEQDMRCHRLQLTDLLVAPMQHCMKTPLLLANIRKYTEKEEDKTLLTHTLQNVENSLKSLEDKMRWLKNFERLQEIQQQLIWPSVIELEPRVFVPEFLKSTLAKQPCERLIANPKRQLLHEGFLTLVESNKSFEVYSFLFDDILLVTRIKKPPKKKSVSELNMQTRSPTDGALFTVHKQPIALDRFSIHDVGLTEATANGLRNAFVLVQLSRFQQIIGVYTFQAPTDTSKITWLEQLRDSQQKFQEKLKAKLQSSETNSPQTNKHSKLLTKIQRMHMHKHEQQHRESTVSEPAVEGLFSSSLNSSTHLPSNSLDLDSGGDPLASSPIAQGPPRTGVDPARPDRPTNFSPDEAFKPTPQSSGDSGLSSHSQDHSYLVNVHGTFSPPLSPTLHAILPPFDQTYDPQPPPTPRSRSTSQCVTAVGATGPLGENLEVSTPRTPKRVSIAPLADEIIPPYIIDRKEHNEEEGDCESATDVYI